MIVIAEAQPTDVEAIAELTAEMDRFYGSDELEPPGVRLAQINDALSGDRPAARAALAWDAERLVGFTAYSHLWPADGMTRSLFVKELFVRAGARREGVGTRLLRAVFQLAVDAGCSRVEWQTETTNVDARAFYSALGGQELSGKVCYRLDGALLSRLAS